MTMTQKKVKIVISPLGIPTIEAEGFNGVGCQDATSSIEAALAGGSGGMERTLKPEWYNQGSQDDQNEQHVDW